MYTGAFAGHIGDYPTRISRGPQGTESELLFQSGAGLLYKSSCEDEEVCQNPTAPEDEGERGAVRPLVQLSSSAQDIAEATRLLSAATEMGHIAAEGLCWEHGLGRAVDPARALVCLNKEAEQGHAGAQYQTACVLWRRSSGDFASAEARSAVRWWRKAASQGHAGALQCIRKLGPHVTRAVEGAATTQAATVTRPGDHDQKCQPLAQDD